MAKILPAAALALALALSGCASETEAGSGVAVETTEVATTDAPAATDETTEAPEATEPPATIQFDLPNVDLTNVATGDTVNLPALANGQPLVLWFWAPH